jgi:NADH-quinone oxidoreductase subunit M
MMLVGAFQSVPLVISISAFSLVFASIYSLTFMKLIYYGKSTLTSHLPALSLRELVILIALAFPVLILGVYPEPVLDISREAISRIYQQESVLPTTSP